MKEVRAALVFATMAIGALALGLTRFQPTFPCPSDNEEWLLVLQGSVCLVIVGLTFLLWVWDIVQNTPEFRFRPRVKFGMFVPFGAAFVLWSAEYFVRAAGYCGRGLQFTVYGVPLLLAISGFAMTGLPDGERIHPLLGAYRPRSSHHHPFPWLTPGFALFSSVGMVVLAGLLVNISSNVFVPGSGNRILTDTIEASINSAADLILGWGLLRILNAHSFDVKSSWPAFLLFFDAIFQWGVLLHPYENNPNSGVLLIAISIFIKGLFVASLLFVLSSVRARSHQTSKIMLSYRRVDSETVTGRIYDHMVDAFDHDRVFRDIDSIPLGIKYRDYIDKIVSTCAVILVIIGPKWLFVEDKEGKRRLDNSDDLLRLEIAIALAKGKRVIPLLVEHATMPEKALLPGDVKDLVDHNGMIVSGDPHFKSDMDRLVQDLKEIIAQHEISDYGPEGPRTSKTEAGADR